MNVSSKILTLVEQQLLRDDDLQLAAGLRTLAAIREEVRVSDGLLVPCETTSKCYLFALALNSAWFRLYLALAVCHHHHFNGKTSTA